MNATPATISDIDKHVMEQLNISNIHAVPRITKVVVNVGVGKQRENKQFMEAVTKDLAAITGQAPNARTARKAISGFNVRQGNVVGYAVTLRGKRMRDFVRRFIHVTLPRVRDFRGVSQSSLDARGNLHVGLREQLAFPEIHPDKTDIIFGVQVTFVTSAHTKDDAKVLFDGLQFPFRSSESEQAEAGLREAAKQKKRNT